MPDTLFQGIFDTERTAVIAPEQFLLCVGASLVIGLVLCAMMLWHTRPSAGFAVTLALGILASMFTAVFVSRQLFEMWIHKNGAVNCGLAPHVSGTARQPRPPHPHG